MTHIPPSTQKSYLETRLDECHNEIKELEKKNASVDERYNKLCELCILNGGYSKRIHENHHGRVRDDIDHHTKKKANEHTNTIPNIALSCFKICGTLAGVYSEEMGKIGQAVVHGVDATETTIRNSKEHNLTRHDYNKNEGEVQRREHQEEISKYTQNHDKVLNMLDAQRQRKESLFNKISG